METGAAPIPRGVNSPVGVVEVCFRDYAGVGRRRITSSADTQTTSHPLPATSPATTSLMKCTPRYKRLKPMTTHQDIAAAMAMQVVVQERPSRSKR
jgi:hypothetical protein